MKAKWRRNAAAAAMVVLVCAAAALNWRYSGGWIPGGEAESAAEPKILGEAALVSGPDGGMTDDTPASGTDSGAAAASGTQSAEDGQDAASGSGAEETRETGLAVDEDAVYSGADYFASARLTRQQARDSAISLLQEAAEQADADQAVANEASEGIQALASYTLKEAQIENLVTAKGYQDCVAFMGNDSVSVVVSTGKGELSGTDVVKITDIAMSETGLPASGVKILAAN